MITFRPITLYYSTYFYLINQLTFINELIFTVHWYLVNVLTFIQAYRTFLYLKNKMTLITARIITFIKCPDISL